MDDLTKLAEEFEGLTKVAEENYSRAEKVAALVGNLKQVHHQIRRAGLPDNEVESTLVESALGKIVSAISELSSLS